LLRDTARGIDTSPVTSGDLTEKKIEGRLDFAEDVIEFETIRWGLFYAAEHAGLEMRKAKLGAGRVQVTVMYSDGILVYGEQSGGNAFLLRIRKLAEARYRYMGK
jgi:DNA polymerase-4